MVALAFVGGVVVGTSVCAAIAFALEHMPRQCPECTARGLKRWLDTEWRCPHCLAHFHYDKGASRHVGGLIPEAQPPIERRDYTIWGGKV